MTSYYSDYDHLFKILLIGDSGVGKTAIILRYKFDEFKSNFLSTMGIDFEIKHIKINNKICKLSIWDTAGQSKFSNDTTSYYCNAHGFILVYDVMNEESFLNISHWICQIEKYSNFNKCQFLLIGNKSDCHESERVVSKQRGYIVAMENNMKYFECSAKNNINIDKIFESITKQILHRNQSENPLPTTINIHQHNLKINDTKKKERKLKCSLL